MKKILVLLLALLSLNAKSQISTAQMISNINDTIYPNLVRAITPTKLNGLLKTMTYFAAQSSGAATNPTSTYFPFNNSGTFSDSWLYQVADSIKLTNGKRFGSASGGAWMSFGTGDDILMFAPTTGGIAHSGGSVQFSSTGTDVSFISNRFLTATATEGVSFTSSKYLKAIATDSVVLDSPIINVPQSTASRAAAFDGSKNLVPSSTTTTELGYVSGVTDTIQTQLDAKTFNITIVGATFSPADNTTYFLNRATISTTETNTDFNYGSAFTVTGAMVIASLNSTSGSSEDASLYLRNVTQGTSALIGTFKTNGSSTEIIATTTTGVSISVAASDWITAEVRTPAYVTNPVALVCTIYIICKP